MLERVARLLRDADVDRNVWGGTFHGIGTRLLRLYGGRIGIHPRFTIHDQGDAEDLMGAMCPRIGPGQGRQAFPQETHVPGHPQLRRERRTAAGGSAPVAVSHSTRCTPSN